VGKISFVFGPSWFYGLDSGFELLVMLITLIIAVYSFRIFLLTKLRKYLYFTLAFVLISGSYLLKAIGDYIVFNSLIGRMPNVVAAVSKVTPIPNLYSMGILAYIFLTFAGFMILVAIFMRINKVRTVSLLFILVFILAVLSQNKFIAFHLTLFIILLYIVIHLYLNHTKKRTLNSFIVLYGMTSLMTAQVFFLLLNIGASYYVVGHVLQLFGFLLLLLNMILVLRK